MVWLHWMFCFRSLQWYNLNRSYSAFNNKYICPFLFEVVLSTPVLGYGRYWLRFRCNTQSRNDYLTSNTWMDRSISDNLFGFFFFFLNHVIWSLVWLKSSVNYVLTLLIIICITLNISFHYIDALFSWLFEIETVAIENKLRQMKC